MSNEIQPTAPSSGGGGSLPGGTTAPCCPTDFVISPCKIVKVDGTLPIAASEMAGCSSAGTYSWTTTSAKIRLVNPNSSTVTVQALAAPSASRDAEVITVTRTAPGCSPVVKTVNVTVAKVTFSASPNQRYGYDNFDTPANSLDDHICVKKTDYTFLKVDIEGGALGTDFDFVCDTPATCTPVAPGAAASFDLRLDAGTPASNRTSTVLHAKVKCPVATSFTQIQVHVYKEREVNVIIAKIDADATGPNLRFPTADYASHGPTANVKLKEGVVKYNLTNFDPANAITPVAFVGGGGVLSYDINANGGADLTAIGTAMTGAGVADKVRVAIIRDMKSYYYLSVAAAIGATTLTVRGSSTFFHVGNTPPIGTGANQETVTITALAGNVITCAPLTKAHAVGETIEFPAAGWGSDPILIMEGSASLSVAKWTILHEVGHNKTKGLALADIIDATDFMNFSQDWTDYRLRYCPRTKNYPAGTTDTENQWETIPRD